MITTLEMNRIIYKDEARVTENDHWIDQFYELWMERYHALNIVKSPSDIIRLPEATLRQLFHDFDFDEMHLFKIHEGANVFALLKDKGDGYWSYQFVVVYGNDTSTIIDGIPTVEVLKDHFDHKEPVLEIPLPNDRKYVED